ncbi:hypothetical protein B5X24_HaOG202247 [Helicoverpa armigera]|uniref:Uncharacterized protein n=1 Tax=Helicoverpa armigera TaxID=29058 RepID=A0A2W1BVH3_HELAM|nr:hypothetical protein B5X24_HaOG202247 [Helicoverpa armigera]
MRRSVGGPPTRWTDLARVVGKQWIRVAEDRAKWRTLGEAVVWQWMSFDDGAYYLSNRNKYHGSSRKALDSNVDEWRRRERPKIRMNVL